MAALCALAAALIGGGTPSSARAEANVASDFPHALVFTSTDMRTREAFAHTGFKLTPFQPLGETGFVLQGMLSSGRQEQRSSAALLGKVQKQVSATSVIGGYQHAGDGVFLALMAGLEWSQRRVSPIVTGDENRGARLGLRAQADLWLRPSTETLFVLTAIVGTASRSFWLRLAPGHRLVDDVFIGPEFALSSEFGETSGRVGLHVTGFEWLGFWSLVSGGIAMTPDGKNGLYGSLALVRKF